MTQRVFVDANVFFSKTLTDWLFLLRLRSEGMFQVHSTEDVFAEVVANMRKKKPAAPGRVTRRRAEILRNNVDEVIEDFPASGEMGAPFTGKDAFDYHVHAAASAARADFVLTCNDASDITQKPDSECYEVIHPDAFFCLVVRSNSACLLPIVREQLSYWSKKPKFCQLDDALHAAGSGVRRRGPPGSSADRTAGIVAPRSCGSGRQARCLSQCCCRN